MKEYPSIDRIREAHGKPCVAFCKYDGSNIRAEWNRKQGWYKFGSRQRLLYQGELAEAQTIFMAQYAEPLAKAIVDCSDFHKPQSALAFLEFFGPHSFAGKHDPAILGVQNNEPKQLILFDVNIHKKGICGPKRFLKAFGHLRLAEVVYEGPMDEEFVQAVRRGEYPVKEGVVCKGGDGFDHSLWMYKIKTYAYLEELKRRFGADWERYE
jgi:hypothetical protein